MELRSTFSEKIIYWYILSLKEVDDGIYRGGTRQTFILFYWQLLHKSESDEFEDSWMKWTEIFSLLRRAVENSKFKLNQNCDQQAKHFNISFVDVWNKNWISIKVWIDENNADAGDKNSYSWINFWKMNKSVQKVSNTIFFSPMSLSWISEQIE